MTRAAADASIGSRVDDRNPFLFGGGEGRGSLEEGGDPPHHRFPVATHTPRAPQTATVTAKPAARRCAAPPPTGPRPPLHGPFGGPRFPGGRSRRGHGRRGASQGPGERHRRRAVARGNTPKCPAGPRRWRAGRAARDGSWAAATGAWEHDLWARAFG